MLDTLPVEIQQHIADRLPQADCLHMALCNKSLYAACIHRLYRAIAIDSSLTYFHQELAEYSDTRSEYWSLANGSISLTENQFRVTIIRTSHGLRTFFRTIERNPRLAELILYLEVSKKLPEHFVELDLARSLQKVLFPRLKNLKFINFWYTSPLINLEILLQCIPSNSLVAINGDFGASKTKASAARDSLRHLLNDSETVSSVSQLVIHNFQKTSRLEGFASARCNGLLSNLRILEIAKSAPTSFPVNYNIINSLGIDFNYLQDSFNKYFYNGMTNNPTNDFGSIFRNTTPATNGGNVSSINGVGHNHESNNSDSTDGNVIPTLFKSPIRSKISLLKLTIDGIVLNSSDSSLLIRCLNLGELQTLSLLDVSEVMKEARFETGLPQLSAETQIEMFDGIDPEEAENIRMESLVPHRIYEKDSFFLVKIAPYLTSLKELNIDHYNDHCDFTPHLISEVSGLQKLYCRLRWNRTKEVFGNEGWNHLTLKYMQAIGGHNESLQHLIIDTLNESNGNVSPIFQNGHETKLDDGEVKAIPSFAFRQYLPQMRQLRSLRLPVSQKHILSLMESVAELTQLEYLEVILVEYSTMQDNFNRGTGQYGGARTGPGPHLGTLLSPSTSSQCLQLTDSETVNLRDAKKILDPQNLMPQNISLNKVLQIAKLFKMYIGERSHNEGPLGTSKNQLRYIKCFNIIVDVWDIHNLQVKERGLDDWFSDKLRGL